MAASHKHIEVVDTLTNSPDQLRLALLQLNSLDFEGSGIAQRKADRHRFSGLFATLTILDEVRRPQASFRIIPIDLSSTGIGFLHGTYAYKDTPCLISLSTAQGDEQISISAKISRCQLVTGRIHSAGARFESQIDVSLFTRHPERAKISPDEAEAA